MKEKEGQKVMYISKTREAMGGGINELRDLNNGRSQETREKECFRITEAKGREDPL